MGKEATCLRSCFSSTSNHCNAFRWAADVKH